MGENDSDPLKPLRLKCRTSAVGHATGMPAWGMFLFGLPFAGIGLWVMLVGLELIPVDPSEVNAPMWVLSVAGLVFFLAGLMVWGMGWNQLYRAQQRKRHAMMYPGEAAMEDYPWDSTGYEPLRWKPVWQALSAAAFMSIFLSMFNWWAFGSGDGPIMVKIIVGIFDLILIFVWWKAVTTTLHAIKFGKSRLEFNQFPFHPGDWLQARIRLPGGIRQAERAKLVLRCVREYYEETGTGKNRSKRLVHEQLWAEEQILSGAEIGQWPRSLKATFAIPAGASGSKIAGEKPIFWELEMELAVPGVDLKQRYLVPVYARDPE